MFDFHDMEGWIGSISRGRPGFEPGLDVDIENCCAYFRVNNFPFRQGRCFTVALALLSALPLVVHLKIL